MMSILLICLGILLCLVGSAFFSSAEMAVSSCSSIRMENLAEEGNQKGKRALYVLRHFDNALSSILIGNNLVNIASSSLASVLVLLIVGSDRYTWVSTVVITVLVIIFGETIPKIAAKKNANRWMLKISGIISCLMIIFYPLILLVLLLIRAILLPFRKKGEETDDAEEAVEELQNIIETAEDEDVLDEDRSELIQSAIEFSDIPASEVMTARVDVHAIDLEDPWDKILETVEESPYSRLPVYEGSMDHMAGVLYLNHFLKALTEENLKDVSQIRKLLMPCIYIYKTMKLPEVLNKLRRSKQHLAVVVDEYGGTLGVVTMEDVLEQIVGEIWDDTDTVEEEVVKRSEDAFEVDGDMPIGDFLELIREDENSFEGESETVGGWTIESIGDFPKPGDSFMYKDRKITVLKMDGMRVERILVEKAS